MKIPFVFFSAKSSWVPDLGLQTPTPHRLSSPMAVKTSPVCAKKGCLSLLDEAVAESYGFLSISLSDHLVADRRIPDRRREKTTSNPEPHK